MKSKFQRNTGAYKCGDCGKLTRDTGRGEEESGLCANCYKKALLENSLNDGDITQEEYEEEMKKLA